MKKLTFKFWISIITFCFLSTSVDAQLDQTAKFMAGSINDAEKLFGAYMTPYANAIGAGLSVGWYNTAKVHKPGGFDISITMNTAIIPKSDLEFSLSDLELEGIPGTNMVFSQDNSPTAAGDKNNANIAYTVDNPLDPADPIELFNYNLPNGSGFPYMITPMVQASVGLFKGSELSLRYSPNLEIGNAGKFGLWGVGMKLGVSEWIPVIEKIPIFNFSVIGGYTKLNYLSGVTLTPDEYDPAITFNPADYDNQEMLMDMSSLTGNLVVGLDVKVVSIYGAIGFSQTKCNLKLEGDYPIASYDITTQDLSVEDITDPIDITIKNSDGSTTKPRYNAGVRFKAAALTFTFDYTYANYSVATFGIGVTFR